MRSLFSKVIPVILGFGLFFAAFPSDAQALKLSDLVKQPPTLYLPTRVVPGQKAVFTLKGKPGKNVKVILSSSSRGLTLPNGTELRVGAPIAQAEGVIPSSGVLELQLPMPGEDEITSDKEYVEAFVWSAPDQSDAESAVFVEHSGLKTENNAVNVGYEADPGNTMLIPGGDPTIGSLMRSINTLNDIGDDPRKKQLVDDGQINRSRRLDQNLNLSPSASPLR